MSTRKVNSKSTRKALNKVLGSFKVEEPSITKFEVTMILDVEDVGGIQANASAVSDSIKEAVEGLSSGDVIKVVKITTGTHFHLRL